MSFRQNAVIIRSLLIYGGVMGSIMLLFAILIFTMDELAIFLIFLALLIGNCVMIPLTIIRLPESKRIITINGKGISVKGKDDRQVLIKVKWEQVKQVIWSRKRGNNTTVILGTEGEVIWFYRSIRAGNYIKALCEEKGLTIEKMREEKAWQYYMSFETQLEYIGRTD